MIPPDIYMYSDAGNCNFTCRFLYLNIGDNIPYLSYVLIIEILFKTNINDVLL